jgi:hypothetical protein
MNKQRLHVAAALLLLLPVDGSLTTLPIEAAKLAL